MPRWVVLGLLVAVAALPGRAMAASCADPGVPGDFDVFVRNGLTSSNETIPGRVAAGGDASLAAPTIGASPPLATDLTRADLVVGNDLTVQNGGTVGYGKVTHGGTFQQTSGSLNAAGGIKQENPEFDFADEFSTLTERSAQWAELAPNGTVTGTGYGVQFTGQDAPLNVFSVEASQMEKINGVVFVGVPTTSTVLINVTMDKTDGSFSGVLNALDLKGIPPEQILWNFPLAESVAVMNWTGSILAPAAAASITNGPYRGSVAAHDLTINGVLFEHHPFNGCLPPKPRETLELDSECTDPFTNHTTMRLRNTGTSLRNATWSDGQGQSGDMTVPAGHDFFFDVLGGNVVHHIVVTSGSTTLTQDTSTRKCAGKIVVHKTVTGLGTPPSGPWRILITGTNDFSASVDLGDGQAATVDVKGGGFVTGSFPIGRRAGGYQFYISEADSLGALVSVDRSPVTILDGPPEAHVTVGNDYPEPTPEPGPEPPVPQPPDPTLPPDSPNPPPAPDLIVASSLEGGADLVVSQRIVPRTLTVGDVITVTTRVRNRGPLAAQGTVLREIPQLDPVNPNQVAQILNVKSSIRAAPPCTSMRPLRCGGNTLAVGAEMVVRVRARVTVAGVLKSAVEATSTTPDPNASNNFTTTGILVAQVRPVVRVAVLAPAVTRVGAPVSYRVVARGAGADGARFVRFCHRPAPGLLVTSAPGTFRSRGRLCRDVRHLRAGQRVGFTVHAIAASRAAGRTLRLLATARAPALRPTTGSDRIAVIAQSFAGTG
jgi:choice-of-anchor A domain-containing protein